MCVCEREREREREGWREETDGRLTAQGTEATVRRTALIPSGM
jgi:hypothetical protein